MKAYHSSLLILFLFTFHQSHAAIEFIYAIKERAYLQSGNSQPSEPAEWFFGAGASGDDQLTAVSITPLGAGGATALVGDEGSYDFETDEYNTQAALDAAYPSGTVSFSVTDGGSSQNLGPFSITGDTYPTIPYFTNAVELQASDFTQDFQLNWNAFTGAQTGDQIILQIWDSNNDEEILFEFLDASTTSFLIPGGTFTAENAYDLDLIFVSETANHNTVETVIGYLSTTTYLLSTYSSDTSLLFYKWRAREQTALNSFTDPVYRPLTTVQGDTLNVTWAQIYVESIDQSYQLNQLNANYHLLTTDFGTKEALDTAYPSGEFSFNVTENDTTNYYGTYFLPNDDYPENPLFQNYNDLLSFDATETQSINWPAAPIGTSLIQVLVLDESNASVWIESLDSTATSVELPADTLSQDQTYRLIIRFWSPKATNTMPPVALGYLSSTGMSVQTTEGGGADPGISLVYAIKEKAFRQTGNDQATTPYEWGFGSGVDGGPNVTGGSLTFPGGTVNFTGETGEYSTDEDEYETQAALDSAYPNGQYTINATVDGSNTALGPLTLSGDSYPDAPHITNAVELQNGDHTQNFTINWNAFAGATSSDRIIIELWNRTTDEDLVFEFLDVSATSYEIPANTLSPGNQYELDLLFIDGTDTLSSPETVVGYITRTRILISTITSDTDLVFYKSKHSVQTAAGQSTLEGYQPIALVRGNSNSVTTAEVSINENHSWLGQVTGNLFFYFEEPAPKQDFDAEFPAGEYYFRVTENGTFYDFAPYTLPPDDYPSVPLFGNFDELSAFDATEDITIEWGAPSSNVTLIGLQIRNDSGIQVWGTNLDPTETSVELPADTLAQFGAYNLTIHFWARKTGGDFPDASLGYRSTTYMSILTASNNEDFASFQAQFFTEQERLDASISGQEADPDKDGLNNFFEFLAKLDPRNNDSRIDFTFDFESNASITASPILSTLNWELQTSTSLESWTTVPVQSYTVVGNKIQIDLTGLPPNSFFRIKLQPVP